MIEIVLCSAMIYIKLSWIGLICLAVSGIGVWIQNSINNTYYAQSSKLRSLEDRKSKLIVEAIQGAKNLKLSALEPVLEKNLDEVRRQQRGGFRRVFSIAALSYTVISAISPISSILCLPLYNYYVEPLDLPRVYAILLYLGMIRLPMVECTTAILNLINFGISADRVSRLLAVEDHVEEVGEGAGRVENDLDGSGRVGEVVIKDGNFSWESARFKRLLTEESKNDILETLRAKDDSDSVKNIKSTEMSHNKVFLKNIDLQLPSGSTTLLIGGVGSGKSSLLAAMVNSMNKISGTSEIV